MNLIIESYYIFRFFEVKLMSLNLMSLTLKKYLFLLHIHTNILIVMYMCTDISNYEVR